MQKRIENILCVPSEKIFEKGKWQGLKTKNLDYYKKLIIDNQEFRPRYLLEEDPNYKQIIAQVILRFEDKYFLHKQVNANETRLNGLRPLFLGGHIEEFDKDSDDDKDLIETALLRELNEEVDVKSNIVKKEFLGLIYLEDEDPVNCVHLGLAYIFDIDGEDVHIREDGLEEIGFVSLNFLKKNRETLTYWSRLIIYHL